MCDHCGCRAFPPIAELSAEHEEILARAWELAEAARAGDSAPADVEALVSLLDVHIAKEETGLYPALVACARLPAERRDELEEEHRVLRRALLAGTFDRREFYALAAHAEVEELELFPAAMTVFDEDRWEAVATAHRVVGDRAAP